METNMETSMEINMEINMETSMEINAGPVGNSAIRQWNVARIADRVGR